MKKVLLVFLILFLMGTQCKKEDCHNIIYINNNSVFQIIAAIKVENADGKCRLDGKVVNSNEKFDYHPFNSCIENNMNNNSFIEIYIADTSHYNDLELYYDCDSVELYSKVLRKYTLDLDELKAINFTINYP